VKDSKIGIIFLACGLGVLLIVTGIAKFYKASTAEQPVVEKKEPAVTAVKTEIVSVNAYATRLIRFKVDGVEYLIWRGPANDILLSRKMTIEVKPNELNPEMSKIY
jgi:hypothetical protein